MPLLVPLFTALAGCVRSPQPAADIVGPRPGLFQNVTDRAGITFRHSNGDSGRYLYPETFGGGCAFLDYDADGWQDVLLLSCGKINASAASRPINLALYHNNGNGTFTDVTRGSGLDRPLGYAQAVAVADYDNDGYPDVFVAGYGGCHLFHNRGVQLPGHPQFDDVTEAAGVSDTQAGPRWASGAAWGDYDGDGRLDLVVIHYAVWTPDTDKRCPRPDGSPGYCVPTVYSGDGLLLYHNDGGGRFSDVTHQAGLAQIRGRGLAVSWLDYDGDGREDIYVANDLDRNFLLRNNGHGAFAETAVAAGVAFGADGHAASGMGIALGDYDHSGRESLFITNINGEQYSLFHNEGRGQFTFATDLAGLAAATLYHTGWGVAFMDFDRDGWVDLLAANGNVHRYVAQDFPGMTYEEPKGLYRNTGRGTFADVSSQGGDLTTPRAARGMAIGDFDNDGRLDALCVNRDDRADLFKNTSPDSNHWINIDLRGVRSNRDAAGAKVWISAGELRQFAELHLQSSYASTSDRRLFFGLGQAKRVDRLAIRWPSGTRQVLTDLPGDRFITMTEGKQGVQSAAPRLASAR